jgi:hypothetical protein
MTKAEGFPTHIDVSARISYICAEHILVLKAKSPPDSPRKSRPRVTRVEDRGLCPSDAHCLAFLCG